MNFLCCSSMNEALGLIGQLLVISGRTVYTLKATYSKMLLSRFSRVRLCATP